MIDLSQAQMPRKGRMVGVVDQLVVDDAVPAPGAEDLGTVDQDAVVPRRHVTEDLGELGPAADREAIEVTRPDVVGPRLVIRPRRVQQSRQSKVDLGEVWLLRQERSILLHAFFGCRGLEPPWPQGIAR